MNIENSILWALSDIEALHRAMLLSLRGKRRNPAACDFSLNRGAELVRLSELLRRGTFLFSPYRIFLVKDPKAREIAAAPFRDRIVHRALFDCLEPLCEVYFHAHTFACRQGRGTSAAVMTAWNQLKFLGSQRFVSKLDVEKYFASIPHQNLIKSLEPLLPDSSLLAGPCRLLEQLVHSFGSKAGIPLGNLTSQLFANWYLHPVDQRLQEFAPAVTFVRYMDDIVIFGRKKTDVLDAAGAAIEKAESLGLMIPFQKRVPLGSDPVPFLGYLLSEHSCQSLVRGRQRFRKHLRALEAQKASEARLARAQQSRLSWALMPARLGTLES